MESTPEENSYRKRRACHYKANDESTRSFFIAISDHMSCKRLSGFAELFVIETHAYFRAVNQ